MKIKSILFALCLTVSSWAGDKIPVQLKPVEIEQMSQAIISLDRGNPQIVKTDGKPDSVVYIPHEFSGVARYALVKNLDVLAKELELFNKTRQAAVKSIWGDKTPDEAKDVEETKKFRNQMEAVMDKPVDLQLYTINFDEFKSNKTIPILVLRTLMPILVEKDVPVVAEKTK